MKEILKEFRELAGQMVLYDLKVYRLIGVGQDEQDIYWILYDGRKFVWGTCVGWITALKGRIDDRSYGHFVHLARLNHLDQPTCWNLDKSAPADPRVSKMNEDARAEFFDRAAEEDSIVAGPVWELR